MKPKPLRWLVATALLTAACSEAVTAPLDQRYPVESGALSPDILAELPEGFETETSIGRTMIDAAFFPQFAWTTASMEFFATHGKVTLTGTVSNSRGTIASETGEDSHADFIPWLREAVANVTIPIFVQCGLVMKGVATFHVHSQARFPWGLERWGDRTFTREKPVRQPDCPPEPCPQTGADGTVNSDGLLCYEDRNQRGDGSGGGGAGCETCLQEPPTGPTWCKVRYKYWLDTGEIFSMTVLYCW